MKPYLLSLGAGLLVGVVYSLLQVRSPAPPVIALLGLLGILGGEQLLPLTHHLLSGATLQHAWRAAKSTAHIFGALPGRHSSTCPFDSAGSAP